MAFEPGRSGNPEGRPKGIKDRRTELRALMMEAAPELIGKIVEMAKAGDATALRMCLDRIVPTAKPKDDPIYLPDMAESLADNSRIVVKAIAEGELTPEEGASVLSALASQVRIIEADEIEKRLTALEQTATNKGVRT